MFWILRRLQGFNWESHRQKLYKQLMGRVKEISAAGFTAVWMPPPSDSVSPQVGLPSARWWSEGQGAGANNGGGTG